MSSRLPICCLPFAGKPEYLNAWGPVNQVVLQVIYSHGQQNTCYFNSSQVTLLTHMGNRLAVLIESKVAGLISALEQQVTCLIEQQIKFIFQFFKQFNHLLYFCISPIEPEYDVKSVLLIYVWPFFYEFICLTVYYRKPRLTAAYKLYTYCLLKNNDL